MPLRLTNTNNCYVNLGNANGVDARSAARVMTIGAWIRVGGQATTNQAILGVGRAGTSGYYFWISINVPNATLNFTPGGAGVDVTILSNFDTANVNKWYFVACAVAPTTLNAFVVDTGGNVQTNTVSNSTTLPIGASSGVQIGSTQTGGGTQVLFNVMPLHNLAVWNYTTLTNTQLRDFAFSGLRSGAVPAPSYYTEFPSQFDNTLRDYSGQLTKHVPVSNGTAGSISGGFAFSSYDNVPRFGAPRRAIQPRITAPSGVVRQFQFQPGSVSSVTFTPAGMTDQVTLAVSSKSSVSFSGLVEIKPTATFAVASQSQIVFNPIGVVRNINAAIASGSAVVVTLQGGQQKVFVRHDFSNHKYISPIGPHLRVRLAELDAATDAASLPSWNLLVNDKQVGFHQELLNRINDMAVALRDGTPYSKKGFLPDKNTGDIDPFVRAALNDIEVEIDRLTP